jgi:hypothetical protein
MQKGSQVAALFVSDNMRLNEGRVPAALDDDFPLGLELTRDVDNLKLGSFDVSKFDRATGFHIFPQHDGCTLGHVFEHQFFDGFAASTQSNLPLVVIDVFDELLNSAIIDFY